MTKFYTQVYVTAWNVILFLFSIGSVIALIAAIGYEGNTNYQQISVIMATWLGVAVFLGSMSLVISAYEKLCRLVELEENKLNINP